MYLTHLSLTNFRNFARLDVDVPPRSTVLAGRNAQGKTSVLEAIYFMAAMTSFQTHSDRHLVNFIAAREPLAVARLTADYMRAGSRHRIEVRLILEPTGVLNGQRLRKEVLVDGVKRQLSESVGQLNAVIFVPQMSQVIEGGPEERRRLLNLTIAQVVPAYTAALAEYNQALAQRNALLKALSERPGDVSQLSVWEESLASLGAQIMLWRIQAIHEIERLAASVQADLTAGAEALRLSYQPAYEPLPVPNGQLGLKIETHVDRSSLKLEEIRSGFRAQLKQMRPEEIARGQTTIGPHRDDLRFLVNRNDLGAYGSRGQIRTTLLALKLAEVLWMRERTREWPVILLDEVMAELDLERRAHLLTYLRDSEQVIFTTTDLGLFTPEFAAGAQIWAVENGRVQLTPQAASSDSGRE